MKDKLPDTLYLLLKEALTDFYKLKKQLAMGINMNVWYSPKNLSSNDTCLVCLAGAIIANMVKDTLLEKKI